MKILNKIKSWFTESTPKVEIVNFDLEYKRLDHLRREVKDYLQNDPKTVAWLNDIETQIAMIDKPVFNRLRSRQHTQLKREHNEMMDLIQGLVNKFKMKRNTSNS